MTEKLKIAAARAALDRVEDGMRLGIGTGSTAEAFIRLLGERVAGGLSIIGAATSSRSAAMCEELGIPITSLEEMPELDLTVDGADEIGPGLALIKGGGAALLREKIVAGASRRMIVIADQSKLVATLGAFPLPVEVNRFGLESTKRAILAAAGRLDQPVAIDMRRKGGELLVTEEGHYLIDASFGRIRDARALSSALLEIPGVVQHGLFIDMADTAFIAHDGGVREIDRDDEFELIQ